MNCARIRIETFLSEKDFEREQRSFCALDDDGRKNDESKSMPTPSTSFDIGISRLCCWRRSHNNMSSLKFELVLAMFSALWLLSSVLIISASPISVVGDENETTCDANSLELNQSCLDHQKFRVPEGCQLIYAKVPNDSENDEIAGSQWATYTLTPRKKGSPVRMHGDIVIQWTDPIPKLPTTEDTDIYNRLLRQYTWDGQVTGGHYEGQTMVESVVSGLGMTARSTAEKGINNILPLVPRVDEGSLTRFNSPGAGAVTRYHNYTWWFTKDLEAGAELVFSREGKMAMFANEAIDRTNIPNDAPNHPSLDYLKENGFCLDNMRPRKSRIKEAGRGAFATRDLEKYSVVAPVPVRHVHRDELRKQDTHQLLLNYCFGHNSSDFLLFPYSPVVNLINHYNEPNVELRWSTSSAHNQSSLSTGPNPGMLLELVASRPIKMGEEIYLDYGRAWEDSWWKHVREVWKPYDKHYTPSYVMDDAIKMIRTEQEQKEHPYPRNLFTSCFYRYSDRSEEERSISKKEQRKDSLTSFRWHLTKGLYDLKNLRPCRILKRVEDKSERSVYAVRMLNRPGLDDNEIIPEDELHIVTHIPRSAIRFSDERGTTDQHLKNAFRHEIGLPEDLIPADWKLGDRSISSTV